MGFAKKGVWVALAVFVLLAGTASASCPSSSYSHNGGFTTQCDSGSSYHSCKLNSVGADTSIISGRHCSIACYDSSPSPDSEVLSYDSCSSSPFECDSAWNDCTNEHICYPSEDCSSYDNGIPVDDDCDGFANGDDSDCRDSWFLSVSDSVQGRSVTITAVAYSFVDSASVTIEDSASGSVVVSGAEMSLSSSSASDKTFSYSTSLSGGSYSYFVTARDYEDKPQDSDRQSFSIDYDCALDCSSDFCPEECVPLVVVSSKHIVFSESSSGLDIDFSASVWEFASVFYDASYDRQELDGKISECVSGRSGCKMNPGSSSDGINYHDSMSLPLSPGSTAYAVMLFLYPVGYDTESERYDESHNVSCTPSWDSDCDEYDDHCGASRDTDGAVCYDFEPCPEDACEGSTWLDYPSPQSSTCLDGACQNPDCTPRRVENSTNCASTLSECPSGTSKCADGELCFSGSSSSPDRCCSGECRPACFPGSECSSGEVCADDSLNPVSLSTVYDVSGSPHSCCFSPGSCRSSVFSCSDKPGFQDCSADCFYENGSSAWQDVTVYDSPMTCCPDSASCSGSPPSDGGEPADCGIYNSCSGGSVCSKRISGLPDYCCDFSAGAVCVSVSDCGDECVSGSKKCEDSSLYECRMTDGCYSWSLVRTCEYGCFDDYSCSSPPEISVSACEDSDSGTDAMTAGSVFLNGSLYASDSCLDSSTLIEWFCDSGSPASRKFECDCRDAVCVSESKSDWEDLLSVFNGFPSPLSISENSPFDFGRLFASRFKKAFLRDPPEPYSLSLFLGSRQLPNAFWVPGFDAVVSSPERSFTFRAVLNFDGRSAEREIVVRVRNLNRPPVIKGSGRISAVAGQPFSYAFDAYDADAGDILSFSFESPLKDVEGVSFDDNVLSWRSPVPGDYPVILVVSDGFNKTSRSFVLSVKPGTVVSDLVGSSRNRSLLSDIASPRLPSEKVVRLPPPEDVVPVLEVAFERARKEEERARRIHELPAPLRRAFERQKKIQKELFIKKKISLYENTSKHLVVKKGSARINRNQTLVRIRIIPDRVMKNVSIYESIPKDVASSVSGLVFSVQPIVIESDPLIMWHFEKVEEEKQLSYVVRKEVKELNTETIPIAEEVTLEEIKKPSSLLRLILPLTLVPIVSIVLIYFSHFKPRKKRVPAQPYPQQPYAYFRKP